MKTNPTPTNTPTETEKVYLACNHKGCPRKIRTTLQGHEPKGTVLIRSVCPWHADTVAYFLFGSMGILVSNLVVGIPLSIIAFRRFL